MTGRSLYTRFRLWPLLIVVAAVAGITGCHLEAVAQEEVEYPHGDFEGECSQCHSPEGWTPARISRDFDHGKSGFPLEGAHAAMECRTCHESLEFRTIGKRDCVACHEDIHQGELGIDCARCHTARSFIEETKMRRMHVMTRFPLTGAHSAQDCQSCHEGPAMGRFTFVGRSAECESCHLEDFQATTDPPHESQGISRECRSCHSTASWMPARFDHGTLAAGSQCNACHLDDYLATTKPDHQAAGFPQDCAACHSTKRWMPARAIDHDAMFFPIFSGKHKDKWDDCVTCHINPTNFSQFSCFDGCHKHADKPKVDDQHKDVGGYTYDSQACFSCHPDGKS